MGGYLGPRTNQDGAVQDLSLLQGSLELTSRSTPDVTLTYQSDTQAKAIVVVETSLKRAAACPANSRRSSRSTAWPGTSYGYTTTGLTAGQTLRFALQADTSALATGRYNWQLDVTTVYSGVPTVHTFTGSTNVVNRNSASAPFGRGWQLSGLDQLSAQTGGVLLVRSDGATLWFADNGSGRLPACRRGRHVLDAREERRPELHALRYARERDELFVDWLTHLASRCQQQHHELHIHERLADRE